SRTGAAARIARRATRPESACKAQPRRLSATRRSGCRRSRSPAAPDFPSATYESAAQGFSRASQVGKLLSADTSPSPCRLFATTSGDFDVSASSFQKTTPSQLIALKHSTRLGHGDEDCKSTRVRDTTPDLESGYKRSPTRITTLP